MIFGDCPYDDCRGPMSIPIVERVPSFERHRCTTCGRVIWTRHSRIDPWSMTEDKFLAGHVVDQTRKTIKRREHA